MMKIILAILFFISLATQGRAATNEVVLIGHFSNMVATQDDDPHIVDGYSVHLYRAGETYFGNLAVATGALEPAQGRLHDIRFDARTKKLRFKSRYVTGWTVDKRSGPSGRESRQLLTFSGKVTRNGLLGLVVLNDGYASNEAGERSFETMKRTGAKYKPKSIEEWAGYKHLDSPWH